MSSDHPLPRRTWRQLAGGLVTGLLLIPIPLYAITFTGSWAITTASKTGAAPTPQGFRRLPAALAVLAALGGPAPAASIAPGQFLVVAKNNFTVASGGELVEVTATFSTLLTKGNHSVRVEFFDPGGTALSFPFLGTSGGAGATSNQFTGPLSSSGFLDALPAGQSYSVRITIATGAAQGGSVSSSPYRLTFGP